MEEKTPSSPVLFSTVTFWKYHIQRRFRNGTHFVWCSEHFDPKKTSAYSVHNQTGPTANPRSIYETLQEAVEDRDTHCPKIQEQKSTIQQLAGQWSDEGLITDDEAQEIYYMMERGDFQNWRPLLYTIPTQQVASRARPVPIEDRASLGPEWIIEDLDTSEFRLVEL